MSETTTGNPSLAELADEIREINSQNGWNVTKAEEWSTRAYKIPAMIALIHSEASEALEASGQQRR